MNIKPVAPWSLTALLVTLMAAGCSVEPRADGQGDDTKKLSCLITNDFYAVRLTTYQGPAGIPAEAARTAFRPYCQELPDAGRTYITIDLLDPDTRSLPMALRVQEEAAGRAPAIIAELSRKTYPTGVVEAVADLPRPGRYTVVLELGEAQAAEDRIAIPLTVDKPLSLAFVLPYALVVLGAVAGLALVLAVWMRLAGAKGSPGRWRLPRRST